MKTKFLLSAVALTAAFTACNNEELPSSADKDLSVSEEIVGANLVSKGGSISIGDAESRVNANGWEDTDKLALAWYNIEDKVLDVQDIAHWPKTTGTLDPNVYANHLFVQNEEGKFVTNSNIYQGAHFIYFPYAYSGKPGIMHVDVNNKPQTTAWNSDALNNALYVSAQDFIAEEDVDAKTGRLAKDFYITPAVNTLKVNVTPEQGIVANDFLKTLEISKLYIWNQDAVFRTNADINPNFIPTIQKDAEGEFSQELTYAKLKTNLADAFVNSTPSSTIETIIDADFTLANANSLRAFTLPTETPSNPKSYTELHVHVKANGVQEGVSYDMGKFVVVEGPVADGGSADKTNNENIAKLQNALYDNTLPYYLHNNINNGVNLSSLGININLLASEFKADYTISNLEEWNLTVDLVDALNSLSVIKVKPEFTLTGAVNVTEGETIKVPVHGLTIDTSDPEAKVSFETDYTVDAALGAIFDQADKLEVLPGAALTLVDNATLKADIHNDGVINVGYKATLGDKEVGANKVDNEHGRINVVYGSYVYTVTGKNGTIAYAVQANEYAYKLNNLMSSTTGTNVLGNAYVNTLVVNEGIELNLSNVDGDTPASDPYINNAVAGASILPSYLKNTTIELVGGTLTAASTKAVVKDIKVLASTRASIIKDVDVLGDLTVAKGANVTIDAAGVANKATASIKGNLKNEGTVTVNVSIVVNKNVYNEKKNQSIISVLGKEVLWYKTNYYQGGMAKGDILKLTVAYTQVSTGAFSTPIDASNKTLDGKGGTITVTSKPANNGLVTGSGAMAITNLNIDGQNKLTSTDISTRALYFSNATNVHINNVNVTNTGYYFNICGAAASKATNTVVINNCTFTGWGSIDNNFASATIRNTHFGFGNYFENGKENLFNGGFRAYCSTVIEDCTFEEGFYLAIEELTSDATLTLKNCKVGSTIITKSNYKSLLNIEGPASNLVYLIIE